MTFRCPTLDEVTDAVLKLLPRGRAWRTNEGLPERSLVSAFNPNTFNNDVFPTIDLAGAVIWQYWRAFANELHFFYSRMCALRLEFWCHSIVETRDDWMKEYGLPDECDPFPDLCVKVSAIGGTRCEYYAEVAARAGWSITCEVLQEGCGSRAGCKALAGRAKAGATLAQAQLRIVVFIDESPAYEPTKRFLPALAGRMRAGRRLICEGPVLLPLKCLLSRVIHAEIFTLYEVRNGS